MHVERFVPGLLARLQAAGGGWLTPVSGEDLVLLDLVPLLERAAAATSGRASGLWADAARMAAAKLWVACEVDSDREVWERVLEAVARAAAERPAPGVN
ncbi:hypothetical protein ACFVVA_36900 [Kitasatospora sp. NPDC058048]|uniref:hypothetical protein n=1 Tax=Kitasatospora sp. NPDC058048 TaxID=3346313 RepID=UPI0036D8DCD3